MVIGACLKFNEKTNKGAITLLRDERGVMKNYVPKMTIKPDLAECLGVQE